MKQTSTLELVHLPLVHQLLYTGLDVISVFAPEKVRREARKKIALSLTFWWICYWTDHVSCKLWNYYYIPLKEKKTNDLFTFPIRHLLSHCNLASSYSSFLFFFFFKLHLVSSFSFLIFLFFLPFQQLLILKTTVCVFLQERKSWTSLPWHASFRAEKEKHPGHRRYSCSSHPTAVPV